VKKWRAGLTTRFSRCTLNRQATTAAFKARHTPVNLNAFQALKESPGANNDVVRTGWMVNIAIAAPRHNAGRRGLDDKLSFNDVRRRVAI